MNEATVHIRRGHSESLWRLTWRQFRRHRLALFSLGLLIVLSVVALFAEQLAPYDPNDIDPRNPNVIRGYPQPPDATHLLGTDDFNRDLLSRALYGMRLSMLVGVFAMLIGVSVGVVVGTVAGYAGGALDNALMRTVDIFLSVPSFMLFLALNALLQPGIWAIVLILGMFSWMEVSRLVRAEFLALKERDFVLAAHAIGVTPRQMVMRHLLPNAMAPIIVAATLAIPAAILSESALSFIGLGVPPPDASLGSMLQDAKAWLIDAWWMWIIPGALISVIVLAFNFVGDGLRDALDPTLHRR
ncbi:MAG: ABC transporter permease [Anaerolineae bacterium]|nr:ABC transporter permease [Anaerolineae bacterium]